MRLTPRTELLIGIAIIVVIALAVVALLIVPQFGALADLDSQLTKANQDVQSSQTVLQQRQSAKNQAAQTQSELMTLQNQVPDSPELPSLIIELQDIATDAGLSWVEVKPQPPESRGDFTAVPLDLKLVGSWSDCTEYVRRITKLERQLRIVSLELAPENDPNTATQGSSTSATQQTTASGAIPLNADVKIEAYVAVSMAGSTSVPGAPSSSETKTPAPSAQ